MKSGGSVLVHCRQGIGRAALIAASALTVDGETPDRAFSRIEHLADTRLFIIGGDAQSTTEIARLKNIAAEIGVADNVTFAGSVAQDRLPIYYSAADVTVVASYYESFGLVPLESLACGTPVVATDVGDLKHILRPGQTGYITSGEIQDMSGKIDAVLSWQNDKCSRETIRASVSQYGWMSIARRIEQECRGLVVEHGVLTY